jgi:hypothetical protein
VPGEPARPGHTGKPVARPPGLFKLSLALKAAAAAEAHLVTKRTVHCDQAGRGPGSRARRAAAAAAAGRLAGTATVTVMDVAAAGVAAYRD